MILNLLIAAILLISPSIANTAEPQSTLAEVFGKKLTATDICQQDTTNNSMCAPTELGNHLFQYSLSKLTDNFISKNKLNIEPTKQEIVDFISGTEMTEQEAKELDAQMKKLDEEPLCSNMDMSPDLKEECLNAYRSIYGQNLTEAELNIKNKEANTKRNSENSFASLNAKTIDPEYVKEQNKLAKQFVYSWKMNKALYDQFGGKILFQQTGIEPIDAYKELMTQAIKNGSIKILDKSLEPGFWAYVNNNPGSTYTDAFNQPWWLKKRK